MQRYTIEPSRASLHGVLSRSIAPVLTIQPGDSVTFRTLEGDWRLEKPPQAKTGSGRFFAREQPNDAGHALCGPVAVAGAKPGMTLAVRVDEVVPANWGWSRVGGGDPDHMQRIGWQGEEEFLLWDVDVRTGICTSHTGLKIAMNPFPGVLTVAPDSEQPVRTHLPGNHGANLDCKEIRRGSTLYLPVFAEGALFSTGDGHAAQGDGEAGCTAIECPMERLTYTFDLLDEPIASPVCKTADGWITFGFDRDLTNATYTALQNMVLLMMRLYALTRREALNLCSMVVDLRTTQIVNEVRGAHAVLRDSCIFR